MIPKTETTPSEPRTLPELLDESFGELELAGRLGPAPRLPHDLWERALLGPLRSFLARDGKGIRGRLVQIAWELGGGTGDAPADYGRIVELLHGASLVIDDIEDGSLRRRGGAALHVEAGLPRALNAANWAYFFCYDIAARAPWPAGAPLPLERVLSRAVLRCHYGQALDVSIPVDSLPQAQVESAVAASTQLKTGALVELSMLLGALGAGADPRVASAIGGAGRRLGVLLQMLDDRSGLTNPARAAKAHEDLALARLTWAWAWTAASVTPASWQHLLERLRDVRASADPSALATSLAGIVEHPARRSLRSQRDELLSELRSSLPSRHAARIRALSGEIDQLEAAFG